MRERITVKLREALYRVGDRWYGESVFHWTSDTELRHIVYKAGGRDAIYATMKKEGFVWVRFGPTTGTWKRQLIKDNTKMKMSKTGKVQFDTSLTGQPTSVRASVIRCAANCVRSRGGRMITADDIRQGERTFFRKAE